MIVFHTDLDNTLIYSYKHDIGEDKVGVEIYQNRVISFMRPEWIEALKRIQKKFLVVPTTTRTMEQYKRISMGIEEPEYALVCNGGILLKHGCAVDSWYQESLSLVSGALGELDRAAQILETDHDRCFEVRFINQLFLFTKSSRPEKSILRLKQCLDETLADVFANGVKVYVLPKKLDKGTAILRMKQKLGADCVISAGDSDFDRPMLLAADMGMCPEGLFAEKQENIFQYDRASFTDQMLHTAENYG